MNSDYKERVKQVMRNADCDRALAQRALRATKGKSWIHAVLYARNELATLSIPTGPEGTLEGLAKSWS